MYSQVKELPEAIQRALSSIGYHSSDVKIEVKDKVSPQVSGGAGQRGVFVMVDLVNNKIKTIQGSWGGANMFNPGNIVDNCDQPIMLNDGIVAISGSTGNKTFATLYVSSANVVKTLPVANITPRQRWILYTMLAYNSAGRKREYEHVAKGPTEEEFATLKQLGFITIAKNGAMKITTNGKNAIGRQGIQSIPYSE